MSARSVLIALCVGLSPTSAFPSHDTCETNDQCLHGGLCHSADSDTGTYRHCHCHRDYGGHRCERYCPLICENGGVCHETENSEGGGSFAFDTASRYKEEPYYCSCLGYWTGPTCSTPYVNCPDGRQCLNGGKCLKDVDSTTSGSYCDCPTEFVGRACEILAVPPGTDAFVEMPTTISTTEASNPSKPNTRHPTPTKPSTTARVPPTLDSRDDASTSTQDDGSMWWWFVSVGFFSCALLTTFEVLRRRRRKKKVISREESAHYSERVSSGPSIARIPSDSSIWKSAV